MRPRRRAKSCPNSLLAQPPQPWPNPQFSLVLCGKCSKQEGWGVCWLAKMYAAPRSDAMLAGGANEPVLRIITKEQAAACEWQLPSTRCRRTLESTIHVAAC